MLALAPLVACSGGHAPEHRVDPRDYRAFFLWGGVRPPPYLQGADSVYLLWGELRHNDPTRIVVLRPEVPRDPGPALWLTVRAERLDWGEPAYRQLLAEAERWQRAGNPVSGVQVDFDSATLGLGTYAAFLRGLRHRLPRRLRLSATGLMDWSAGARASDLSGLEGVLDEVVVQTYQDRATIPGYRRYLPSLARLPIPYRIGLIEHGVWTPPAGLTSDPHFRGYVVFLQRS